MLKFYNTLSNKKEEFKELKKGEVRMYTCGPTVYNFAHIGNFRAYMFEDLLRRYLKYNGYKVIQVMNITDVEDKTIRGAKEKGISLKEFTEEYTKYFFEDLDKLKIERAEYYPKATEHIKEMVEIVKKLQKKEMTYDADGSIYFKISKFPEYGKLSKIKIDQVKSGARYDADEYEKDDVRDFVLWKAKKEDEPSWQTELGEGRPGWHIECSAMSIKYLGESFDIHTGGVDNIFPHHENEIAQSEAATGKKFVNYWLHCAHLTMKQDKMSKSKGNIINIRDLVKKGIDPMVIRYFLLSAHYRSPLNFGEEELEACKKSLERLNCCISNIMSAKLSKKENEKVPKLTEKYLKLFEAHMDDDLNISGALGDVFSFVRELNVIINKESIGTKNKDKILNFFKKINTVINVFIFAEAECLESDIEKIISEREAARKNKDFKKSDEIRDKLLGMGIILEDTKDGIRWKKK